MPVVAAVPGGVDARFGRESSEFEEGAVLGQRRGLNRNGPRRGLGCFTNRFGLGQGGNNRAAKGGLVGRARIGVFWPGARGQKGNAARDGGPKSRYGGARAIRINGGGRCRSKGEAGFLTGY